ncbi:hypothetical protein BBK82_28080 [Lentzea guizhouensis]|uniref:Uncharacterized protein n=1 Tax=Lentzea guizhouensis TaxID=1586287 RepID=A0A1B2HNQ0_9PSEU|nr:hypothetical protein BBK82_28080 [Lentzea guizhouensis]
MGVQAGQAGGEVGDQARVVGVDGAAGGVEEHDPAVDPLAEAADDTGDTGADGGTGEGALGLAGAGEGGVLVGGKRFGDGLADGDERDLARHLDEPEAGAFGGVGEGGRDGRVAEAGAEAEADDPGADEPVDVVLPWFVQPGGQQQLPAFQERRRVRELRPVHPPHRPRHVPGQHRQPQRHRELVQRDGHVPVCTS